MRSRSAVLAVAFGTSLLGAVAPAAHAGPSQYQCGRGWQQGDTTCVAVSYKDNRVHEVVAVMRGGPVRGHFQFFGPGGHLENSGVKEWRTQDWTYTDPLSAQIREDDRWCVRFWEHVNGGVRAYGSPNCVTL